MLQILFVDLSRYKYKLTTLLQLITSKLDLLFLQVGKPHF